jgi:hypothetical protein
MALSDQSGGQEEEKESGAAGGMNPRTSETLNA